MLISDLESQYEEPDRSGVNVVKPTPPVRRPLAFRTTPAGPQTGRRTEPESCDIASSSSSSGSNQSSSSSAATPSPTDEITMRKLRSMDQG